MSTPVFQQGIHMADRQPGEVAGILELVLSTDDHMIKRRKLRKAYFTCHTGNMLRPNRQNGVQSSA